MQTMVTKSKTVVAWGGREWQEAVIIKEHEETFGDKKWAQHCDFGDGFPGMYTCQNLPNCMLEICGVCC